MDLVVVVDDGSTDGTLRDANLAEVQTVKHQANMGKAQAMTSGVTVVSLLEAEVRGASHSDTPRALLFVDADLGESAANLAFLCVPVLAGRHGDRHAATADDCGRGFGFAVRGGPRGHRQARRPHDGPALQRDALHHRPGGS